MDDMKDAKDDNDYREYVEKNELAFNLMARRASEAMEEGFNLGVPAKVMYLTLLYSLEAVRTYGKLTTADMAEIDRFEQAARRLNEENMDAMRAFRR